MAALLDWTFWGGASIGAAVGYLIAPLYRLFVTKRIDRRGSGVLLIEKKASGNTIKVEPLLKRKPDWITDTLGKTHTGALTTFEALDDLEAGANASKLEQTIGMLKRHVNSEKSQLIEPPTLYVELFGIELDVVLFNAGNTPLLVYLDTEQRAGKIIGTVENLPIVMESVSFTETGAQVMQPGAMKALTVSIEAKMESPFDHLDRVALLGKAVGYLEDLQARNEVFRKLCNRGNATVSIVVPIVFEYMRSRIGIFWDSPERLPSEASLGAIVYVDDNYDENSGELLHGLLAEAQAIAS